MLSFPPFYCHPFPIFLAHFPIFSLHSLIFLAMVRPARECTLVATPLEEVGRDIRRPDHEYHGEQARGYSVALYSSWFLSWVRSMYVLYECKSVYRFRPG